MHNKYLHYRPFILTLCIVVLDQITKLLIVRNIPINSIGVSYLDGFFRIIHVRNLGAAFSIGNSLSPVVRTIVLIIIPVIVVIGLIIYIIRSKEISETQRWLLSGIVGGGIGNVFFDRIFRPEGVVDFLDFRFFGIFGLERWPTFNVADMSTVICGILLIITLLFNKSARVISSDENLQLDSSSNNEQVDRSESESE